MPPTLLPCKQVTFLTGDHTNGNVYIQRHNILRIRFGTHWCKDNDDADKEDDNKLIMSW